MRRILGRCLEQSRQHRCLGEGDVGDLLAEIELGRCRDAEVAAAHIGAVEIELEDLVLGIVPLQPDREEGLLDLALERALGGEEQVLGQLLGDRGPALQRAFALRVAGQRAQRADHVDAPVLVKAPVLGGERRLDEIVRQLVERKGIVGADAAPANLGAVAVKEHHRDVLGLVDAARGGGVEGRKRQRGGQHHADGGERKPVGEDFDEQALEARDAEAGEEILEPRIAAAQRVPEIVKRGIKPGVRSQHAGFLAALLFVIEGILQEALHAFRYANSSGRSMPRPEQIYTFGCLVRNQRQSKSRFRPARTE